MLQLSKSRKKNNIELKTCLDIDDNIYVENPNDFYKNKSIYLLHYKFGDKVVSSFGSIYNITDDFTINHKCSTDKGSSGGPIINSLNYKVIGIHKGYKEGKNFNLGSLIKKPIEDFFNDNNIQNNIEDFLCLSNQNNSENNNNDDINNKNINNKILNKRIEHLLQTQTKIYEVIYKNKNPPLYLEQIKEFIILENWEKIFELSIKNRNRHLAKRIISFLVCELGNDNVLIEIIKKFPDLHNVVIETLKHEDYEIKLRKYLFYTGNFENLFFMIVEDFFKCKTFGDRKEYLREAKKILNEMKGNKNHEFYTNYINDLNNL